MKNDFSQDIKILIVDDTPENLGVLFQLLSEDYEVLAAENGKIALDIIAESQPDLVLLDIMMPVLDGYEVIKFIRKSDKTTALPVIFMSALSEDADRVKGLKLGANDYISKPFNAEEVMLRVNTQVKIIKYHRELQNVNIMLEEKVKERTSELNENLLELEKLNSELKFSENRYRVLFEDAPDAIVLLDINTGKVVDANPAASNLFGLPRKEIKGKDQREIFQNTEENVKRNISVVNTSQGVPRSTHRLFSNLIIRPDGQKIPVESTARTIFLNGNIYLQGIMRDISERKIVEEQLQLAKEKAEEMNKLKSNFLANMSHELRTPLISILGFSQFLIEELEDFDHKQMADMINRGGKRLLDTLNLILDISRIETGKISIRETNVNVYDVIRDVASKFKDEIIAKDLNLVINKPEFAPLTKADENMLMQILENILGNAVKFTMTGKITISTVQKEINTKKYVSVIISDTGIGIPPEKTAEIFSDFRQASEGSTRNFDGIGLGLTIANRFIDYLGGYLELESVPEQGSTFTINLIQSFPESNIREKLDKKLESISPEQTGIRTRKPKLLYLEHDFATREFAKLILEKEFTLDAFETSDEVLLALEENYYDIFLIDVNLQNSEYGIHILEALNNSASYKRKPKIAVTAFAMKGDKEKLLELGFTHYLSKPFDKKSLLELVQQLQPVTD